MTSKREASLFLLFLEEVIGVMLYWTLGGYSLSAGHAYYGKGRE